MSLDLILNKPLIEPGYNATDWDYVVMNGDYITHLFTSVNYVLQNMEPGIKFNLLAVVIEPEKDCKDVQLEGFDFVGYDLLDREYGNSALTNCGGFDETFLPSELNRLGLIYNYEKAFNIKQRLLENNPEEHHADTNVIAIWRHKTIGRREPNH